MSLLQVGVKCVVVSVSGFFLLFDLMNAMDIWELFVVNSCCVQKYGCMDWGLCSTSSILRNRTHPPLRSEMDVLLAHV